MSDYNIKFRSTKGINATFESPETITLKNLPVDKQLTTLNDVTNTAPIRHGDVLTYNPELNKFIYSSGNVIRDANNQFVFIGDALLPAVGRSVSLGTFERPFASLFVTGNTVSIGNLNLSDTGTGTVAISQTEANGNITIAREVSFISTANLMTFGTDAGNVQFDLTDGAVTDFSSNTVVADMLDKLNECMLNVYKDTFVRNVSFTSDLTQAGIGTPITLTITTEQGTPNQYDVSWGDGSWSNGITDSTPTHTYTDNTNSPMSVFVEARHTDGEGAGSNSTFTRADYITIFTTDPIAGFELYQVSSGGSIITEANTTEPVYMENTTTEVPNTVATASFTMDWGDSSTDTIASKVSAGGPQGDRLAHTYTSSSGTGLFTLSLDVDSLSTATPGIFPITETQTLKVFDIAIAAPNDITTKTISWSNSSTGSSPKLAFGFTENSTGKSAGDSISSSFPRITSGTVSTSAMSTYFHTTGSITQQINDTSTGSPTVDEENVDFYNYNASGTAVSASQRIYAEGLYETGAKARVSYDITTGASGVNKAELVTDEGNSNELYYVYDAMTSSPVLDVSSATVTEGTGNYRYVSGVPFYDDNSTLVIGGVTMTNISGETYYGASNPYTISSVNADPIDGTEDDVTGSIISSTDFDHQNLIPSANRSSNIPNVSVTSAVSLEDATVTVSSSARRVGQFTYTGRNVNGSDTETISSPYILVHSTTPPFDETAISVSDSLGSGYTTDATRLTGFTGATPSFGASTDFYTDNAWSGAVTVAGTDEAIFWLGTLKHFDDDLSTGYLPVGPDLATGRSGTQYARFAFKRSAVSNIRVRLTGKVSGFFIASPSTAIDSASTINGWLDASAQYAGSGVPGADTSNGGNGSNGCAFTGGDIIVDGTTYSNQTFDLTLGTVSTTNSYENQILISVALNSDDFITSLSFEST
jgi:hypothetical protein